MDNSSPIAYQRNMLRLVFIFILASLLSRYLNHVLLHQLLEPVIYKTQSDLAYWLYHIAGIGKYIVQDTTLALVFDCLLVGTAVTTIFFVAQRISVVMFSFLYLLYFLSYNAFVTHHTGNMNGILLITLAFWTTRATSFSILWEGLRYFTLAVYCMAFFWKAFVGVSIFHFSQAEAILKEDLVLYLYQNPDTVAASCLRWFLQHPVLLYMGYCSCILMQGLMAIGFFTKKYDYILFFLPVFFHLCTYLFVDVCYFELLILNFTFISARHLQNIQAWFQRRIPLSKTKKVTR